MNDWQIIEGDCRDVLRSLPTQSVAHCMALVEYAEHKQGCKLRTSIWRDITPRQPCTCGLDVLLERVRQRGGDAK